MIMIRDSTQGEQQDEHNVSTDFESLEDSNDKHEVRESESDAWSDILSGDLNTSNRSDDNSDCDSFAKTGSKATSLPSSTRLTAQHHAVILIFTVPHLLSLGLPPCGLISQIAYENINTRLRTLWLHHTATHHNSPSLVDICTSLHGALAAEADVSPPNLTNNFATHDRTPWRREDVFAYEIRWSKYFVREAKMLEKALGMAEMEREKLQLMDRLYPIPKELRIVVKKRENKKGVMDAWTVWHKGKRGHAVEVAEGEAREAREAREAGGNSEASNANEVGGRETATLSGPTNLTGAEVATRM